MQKERVGVKNQHMSVNSTIRGKPDVRKTNAKADRSCEIRLIRQRKAIF